MPKTKYPDPLPVATRLRSRSEHRHKYLSNKALIDLSWPESEVKESGALTWEIKADHGFRNTRPVRRSRNKPIRDPSPYSALRSSCGALDEATVEADDPRACPRDPDEFRLALALELDRLREKQTILDE